ncbi:hypothetical protein SCHPADRAFT_129551 [Schizopora paradoxa]|uniref:Uncharacterized protein n=1 Tax=Schizopora paradoxa TaxID=27342 RepID=A0A0H2S2P1_9AGAM|nr:hypothetical protein SCHPADRAFT_129551 [Schizopora paradoxa]
MPGPRSILSWMDNFSNTRFPRLPDPAATRTMQHSESTTGTIPPQYEPASQIANRLAYDVDGPTMQSPQPASSSIDATFTPDATSVPAGDHEVISEQPLMSPTMSFNGLPPPSVTTFANVRGPNLSKLTEVYYRLSSPSGPFDSYHRMYADDPSISYIYAQHVPPPGIAQNFIDYICSRERIHPSRAKLFIRDSTSNSAHAQLNPVQPTENITLSPGGIGLSELFPLIVSIDVPGGVDRATAARPISIWAETGIAAEKVSATGCSALKIGCLHFGKCLIFSTTVLPRTFCGGFRSCWIDCWSCGNPKIYERHPDNYLFCCCCWTCSRHGETSNGRLQTSRKPEEPSSY